MSKSLEETLKKITSGDTLTIERKFSDPLSAVPIARCVFAVNEIPVFLDKSNGLWDRLRLIPFKTVIRNTDKEVLGLGNELKKELPGILNWAIEGLEKLRKFRRFPISEEGWKLLESHRLMRDHELEFLSEYVNFSRGEKLSSKERFKTYQEWMKENGYNPMGDKKFNLAVQKQFGIPPPYRQSVMGGKKMFWDHLKLEKPA